MSTIKMRITGKAAIILGISLALFASGPASAGDTVQLRLYNDASDSIVVTVWDLNGRSPGPAVVSERINGFAWIPIFVSAGAVGKGHVKWIARTVDPTFHRCGYQEMRGVANDALVYVSVNSSCLRNTR